MQCFLLKSNTFHLCVTLLDEEERLLNIPVNQKASTTLCNIAKSISLTSIEYFGLKYLDKFQKTHWVNTEKSLYRQLKKSQIDRPSIGNTKGTSRYSVLFEVRYYPRDPTSINNENFRYQIFLQIRKDLTSNRLAIKDDKMVPVLCALILQSDFGDYESNRFAPHYVRQSISSHLLTAHTEDQIKNEHIKLRGVEPIDAEYQFLEKARWLESYGTIIFPVKDNDNRNCYLGLNPQGFALRFYKDANMKYDIFWPRISGIRRRGRQLVIKEKCDTTVSHRFETGEKALCKALHKLSLEHYAFFKLKKDDKPLIKEPTKRTFGKSSSKEFGYSSDTSDNNQYSDDTSSSYPDSINTTQSSKMTKGFKKTTIPIRNCISDAEESAFSRKNRKVIVCKSQSDMENEIKMDNDECHADGGQHHAPLDTVVSHERIPADYIYENRLKNPQVVNQIRLKRLTKKAAAGSGNERRFHGPKEMEPYLSKTIAEPLLEEGKYQIPFKSIRTREAGFQVTRSKSGDGLEDKARIRRKLPQTDILPHFSEKVLHRDYDHTDQKLPASTSADSILSLRPPPSPTKRILPSITPTNFGANATPPVPQHRLPPKSQPQTTIHNRPQSLYTDVRFKPPLQSMPFPQSIPPRVPQRTCYNQTSSREAYQIREEKALITSKSYLNYGRKSVPETGI